VSPVDWRLPLLGLAAYLAGSLNVAIVVLRLLGKEDPRTKFSGNPGTTNVYRQAGPAWAAVVLLLDVGRAAGIGLAACWWLPLPLVSWPALPLVVGNRYPLFHGFKGGKGVANYLGYTALVAPWGALAAAAAWVGLFAVVRLPFVASFLMIAVLCGATMQAVDFSPAGMVGTLLVTLFITWNHRQNLRVRRRRS